jgi:protein arginine kinase
MGDKEDKNLIRELRDTTGHWVKGIGPLNHIVVSSRIRLARNIQDIPFPFKASDEQLRIILDKSEEFVEKNKKFKNFRLIRLNDLTAIDVQFLVEKRLISIAQAQFNRPYRAFIYNTDEVISIMVNEEDHYRIQCIQPGFQLKKVWELIDWYDDQIGEAIDYAFNENEGFLTCCPTNVGTGLRASVMMHLPALIVKNRLNDLMDRVSKAGYAVRGFYGEGTDFQGNLFQVSNQSTLGLKEAEIIEKLELISSHLIEKEQEAREEIIIRSKHKIEDQVMRAYGVLTNAKMISTNEALDLLLQIRFGIELGILAKVGYDTINRLMLIIQPGYLQLLKGKEMGQEQRNLNRALLIQELLN